MADQLAHEAAFFSIGSNELIQYVMVADRTNPRVAAMADPFQPAVVRMLSQTIEAGRRAGIDVVVLFGVYVSLHRRPVYADLAEVSEPSLPAIHNTIA